MAIFHNEHLTIRPALQPDGPTLLSLIDALADYEKLTPPDEAAKRRLLTDMFAERPRIQPFLAFDDGVAVGYALIFETYSSFLALPTLYLEDFFVLPAHRGKKIGFHLFRTMVGEAHRRGCGRMEWSVLAWNQLALDFYERMGARHLYDWKVYRLVRSDMERILAING